MVQHCKVQRGMVKNIKKTWKSTVNYGIVNMSFPLSDQPVLGEWLVFVDMQGHTYNKSFEVEVTYPDGSPADGVTIRIKAELTPKDNVYTSELRSRGGLVEFEIPSIPTAAQYVWLETKVTAIDGRPAGDQYLPNYLSISSWYSPSKCHVQLQGPSAPLQVGVEAQVSLKSTCPCDFTLHYELASRGNIVQSGYQPSNVTLQRSKRATVTFDKNVRTSAPARPGAPKPPSPAETDVCVTILHFPVTYNMAPLSRLLVYYVRENGEGVTDSIQLPVQPAYENQVSISLSSNESMPGDVVNMRVRAERGSCVCVATVDKSLYLLKPGFQLTTDKIFQDLADFDVSDAFGIPKDDGHFWWPGLSSRRRRRSSVFPWHWDITKDARFAFTETGLVVMTDMVSLNHRQNGGMYTNEAVPAFQPHTGTLVGAVHSRNMPRAEKRRRTFFPETWIWHCLNVSDITGEGELWLEVPDSITTWITEAVGLSDGKGLGLAAQTELRAFKPFFVDFALPYSVIRGEQSKILLTVYNYLPVCAEVHVKVSVPKGIKFVGHPAVKRCERPNAPLVSCPVFCSDITGEGELWLEVPDSITTWITEAVGLSDGKGLGLAAQTELRAFKPFFVDFALPYSVIRGEQSKILLTVYNYLPVCAEVHVKVSVPKGIKFVGHPGRHHLTRKKCVPPGEARPTSIVLSFSELGLANITARAFAYSEVGCCDEGVQSPLKNGKHLEDSKLDRRTAVGMDSVRRSVLVQEEKTAVAKAKHFLETNVYSADDPYTTALTAYALTILRSTYAPVVLRKLNNMAITQEKIHISTPNKYEYQYVKKPSRMTHFDVAVKAHNDAHLALSSGPHDTAGMVEIVIGGRQNSRTWVSASKMGEPLASAGTEGILSWDEFRNFWVSWRNGVVQVGHGAHPSNESVITEWAGLKLPQVKYVGFSTGWGSVGEFKIWRKEDSDENHNEAFTLGVPHNVVPGSERASASMIGDVMGPTLNNLDNLLKLPFGCGEQNMIHFAPNVFVLKYLQKTKQLNPEVEGEATDYLLQGYQRQLTYKRQDGSYSAFGERDSSGSMWLTAFVLKSFAQSRGFIFIDPKELSSAKDWIIQHQKEDGSFPAVGRILNKDIQGGIHGKISLTAYVVAALLETGITSEEEKTAVAKAKHFLETNVYSADDPYTTALTAYALTILRSTYAPVVLRKLNNMAITQDGFTHWSLTGTTVTDEDTFMGFNDGLSQSVVSAEVEMTAYALLTYTLLGDVATALPVVKWLSQKRNALGGFSSTQDTCVALQALSEYAILSFVGGVNLTISLASTNLDFQETFELNKANKKILQTALIDVSYNVPDPVAKPAFQLTVTLKEPKPGRHHPQQQRPPAARPKSRADNRSELSRRRRAATDDEDPAADQDHQEYQVSLEACARWLHAGSSNMAVLEVPLLSGFRADLESLEKSEDDPTSEATGELFRHAGLCSSLTPKAQLLPAGYEHTLGSAGSLLHSRPGVIHDYNYREEEEEPEPQAEVSYYSYEYDSDPYVSEGEDDAFDLGGEVVTQSDRTQEGELHLLEMEDTVTQWYC
ncbi:UNVERIFIED_CONTAM: hypothetical protein FKN15_054850 [Acipenser sinensis]